MPGRDREKTQGICWNSSSPLQLAPESKKKLVFGTGMLDGTKLIFRYYFVLIGIFLKIFVNTCSNIFEKLFIPDIGV